MPTANTYSARVVSTIILLMLAANSSTMAADFDCPRNVRVKQQVTDRLGSWHSVGTDKQHALDHVRFFDGVPTELASLKYTEIKEVGEEIIAQWDFIENNKNKYWIVCKYAESSISLQKPIEVPLKGCTVTYEKLGPNLPPGKIKLISCKERANPSN